MIDTPLIRHAAALVEDVRYDSAPQHVERIAAWAATDPHRVAELAVTLAAFVTEDITPDRALDLLSNVEDMDLSGVAREAHRIYARYQSRRQTHNVPGWVLAGERLYQREKKVRQRARKGVA